MKKEKCSLCKTSLEARRLTLTPDANPLSLTAESIESFECTNVAFACGQEGCRAIVCHECIDKLERRKEGRLFSKREHLICPKCGEVFGEGGADFLIEGRLPPEVRINSVRTESDKFRAILWLDDGPMAIGTDVAIPTSHCCLCMSTSVFRVLQNPPRALCKGCFSLLTHPAISPLGWPYAISAQSLGPVAGAMRFRYANLAFMDLIKAANPHTSWHK